MQMNKAILRNSEIVIFDKKIISQPPCEFFFQPAGSDLTSALETVPPQKNMRKAS